MPRNKFPELEDQEVEAAFHRAMTDPVCCFLNEISMAETQHEAADILAASRELLCGLTREHRDRILRAVDDMVEDKPEI